MDTKIKSMYMKSLMISFALLFSTGIFAQQIENFYNLNDITTGYVEEDTLWIGTTLGLVKWSISTKEAMEHFHEGNSKLGNRIHKIRRSSTGVLWVWSGDQISWLNNDGWQTKRFTIKPMGSSNDTTFRILNFELGHNGEIWVVAQGRLIYSNNDGVSWQEVQEERKLTGGLFVDKKNVLWFVKKDGRLYNYDQGKVAGFATDSLAQYAREIYIDNTETIWLAGKEGIQFFNGGYWETVVGASAGFFKYKDFIFESNDGLFWLNKYQKIVQRTRDSFSVSAIDSLLSGHRSLTEPTLKAINLIDVKGSGDNTYLMFVSGLYNLTSQSWYPYFKDDTRLSRHPDHYHDLFSSNDEDLLLLTKGFILKRNGGEFEKIYLESKMPENSIKNVMQDGHNNLWIHFSNAIRKIDKDGMVTDFRVKLARDKSIVVDSSGVLWGYAKPNNKIFPFSIEGETLSLYNQGSIPDALRYHGTFVTDIGPSLYLFKEKGCFCLEENNWEEFVNCPDGFFGGVIKRKNVLWMVKDSLYTYTNGRIRNQNINVEYNHYRRKSLYIDGNENIWVIANKNEIIKIDSENKRLMLTSKKALGIAPNSDEEVAISSGPPIADKTLLMLNGETMKGIKTGKKSTLIWSKNYLTIFGKEASNTYPIKFNPVNLFEDDTGNWWFNSSIQGLFKLSAKELVELKWNDLGLPFEKGAVRGIFGDGDGQVWFTLNIGIVTLNKNNTWGYLSVEECGNIVTHRMVESDDGALWFGGNNGIVKIKDGKKQIINRESGLLHKDVKNLKIHNGYLYIFYFYGYSTVKME